MDATQNQAATTATTEPKQEVTPTPEVKPTEAKK